MEKLTAVSVRFSYTDKLNNRLTTFDLVCSARHWRNSRQVKKIYLNKFAASKPMQ